MIDQFFTLANFSKYKLKRQLYLKLALASAAKDNEASFPFKVFYCVHDLFWLRQALFIYFTYVLAWTMDISKINKQEHKRQTCWLDLHIVSYSLDVKQRSWEYQLF